MREFFTASENKLHKVHHDVAFEKSVLIEPLTIGAQATSRGDLKDGDTVLIQGAGPIGLCILKYAKLNDVTVFISDLDQSRLDYAKEQGADVAINVKDLDLVEEIHKLTDGEGVNVSIDAVCMPKTFELSINVASAAGRVVVLGFDEKPANIIQMPITKNELTIVGSRLQTYKFKDVIENMENHKFDDFDLVTQQYDLNQVKEAFQFIDEHPEKIKKQLLISIKQRR